MSKDVKMVIVMRKDLKNKKGEKIHTGKVIAQAVHSGLGFVWDNVKGKKICFEMSDEQYEWYNSGQTKITLKVDGEKALMEIFQKAKAAGVFVELITDAGRTEFDGPTKTCLALGPDTADKIDKITGGLSLY
jgi:peptidyl-tRNA hydrolase, PTH2 family